MTRIEMDKGFIWTKAHTLKALTPHTLRHVLIFNPVSYCPFNNFYLNQEQDLYVYNSFAIA
ncbi:hypothetical protein M3663_03340 [Staphylococcus xylosus]|uniref:hypothetical protein n=1 Tax=Staphylococcus xylosus TaxID=1288 RepID=UPI002042578E|nr:hypothetical protein [Staphylococcus xylosus]MCM3517958.1 hypothetical protein [Staphylococcus xylosus]